MKGRRGRRRKQLLGELKEKWNTKNCKKKHCVALCGERLWPSCKTGCCFNDIGLKRMDPDSELIGTPANAALPQSE